MKLLWTSSSFLKESERQASEDKHHRITAEPQDFVYSVVFMSLCIWYEQLVTPQRRESPQTQEALGDRLKANTRPWRCARLTAQQQVHKQSHSSGCKCAAKGAWIQETRRMDCWLWQKILQWQRQNIKHKITQWESCNLFYLKKTAWAPMLSNMVRTQ